MLTSLLDEAAGGSGYSQYIMLGIVVLLIVVIAVFYFFTNKKRKKQEQDAQDLINAVKPGNKVKTIGGICGIVVEVDNEENTFVLETGTETSGKSYIKFDRQAIYQTDAVVEKKEDKPATAEITDAEPVAEGDAVVPAPAEAPAVEEKAEEVPAPAEEASEAAKPKKKGKKDEEEKQVKF
ncbi:MAG: preprotein translocase subunit YajC [Clostridia bacterium]|nr:preprotein translocase subunit YajC [Clostridia bacterium]